MRIISSQAALQMRYGIVIVDISRWMGKSHILPTYLFVILPLGKYVGGR